MKKKTANTTWIDDRKHRLLSHMTWGTEKLTKRVTCLNMVLAINIYKDALILDKLKRNHSSY